MDQGGLTLAVYVELLEHAGDPERKFHPSRRVVREPPQVGERFTERRMIGAHVDHRGQEIVSLSRDCRQTLVRAFEVVGQQAAQLFDEVWRIESPRQ